VTRRVLATPWRLLLAVTAAREGHDLARLLAARPGEDPAAAEKRIVADLMAAYIPAAIQLGRRDGGRYRDGQAQRWLHSLARHLDWQAAYAAAHLGPPAGMTGVDIVPHLLWPIGGMRLVCGLHLALNSLAAATALAATAFSMPSGRREPGPPQRPSSSCWQR
jgi:hypothetical protein